MAPYPVPVPHALLPYLTPTWVQTHLLRTEDHFVFPSSASHFVSIDETYRQKGRHAAQKAMGLTLDEKQGSGEPRGTANPNNSFLMKGFFWPRPSDIPALPGVLVTANAVTHSLAMYRIFLMRGLTRKHNLWERRGEKS